jgi:LPXTG cell wall anchor motif
MKRIIFSILAIFLLTAGAVMAQGPNTTAPGPTQQREPGQNSNNLPNPGNPQTDLSNRDTFTEGGTVEGTANESITGTAGSQTTGNVQGTTGTTGTTTGTGATSLQNETEDAEGMDVDVDTGANAAGAVDVDVNSTADADTDASGIDETGTDTYGDTTETGALPDTAGEMPLLVLAGLLALASAFMVRVARRA